MPIYLLTFNHKNNNIASIHHSEVIMAKASLPKRRAARKAYAKTAATSKPGTGKRAAALKKSVAASGASNPGAVIATIGREKYGKEAFQEMAAKGRSRAAKKNKK